MVDKIDRLIAGLSDAELRELVGRDELQEFQK